MRRLIALSYFLFGFSVALLAQKTVFDKVKIHREKGPQKRVLVDKVGTLTFDDSARELGFESKAGDHIKVGYDDVSKIICETTTHMRGGLDAELIKAASLPGLITGNVLASRHFNDYWFYLEYKGKGEEKVLIDLPETSTAQVESKATSVFGSRLTVADFPEKGAEIKIEDLKAAKSKQSLKVDKKNHPTPELRTDKATIVIVCPSLAARLAGTGIQFKVHANDRVVAVNRMGTYSIAYLDPGKYRLVSQAENANGFEMELEAGKQYYFLQNTFQQTIAPNQTVLSRNSRELVMYLLDGSYFSDWKPK